MGIRIAFCDGGYVATAAPPQSTVKWESNSPMTGRDLVDALLKLGCHLTDIADAFYDVDPDWLEHLDSRPE